ncbi:MAG TPA: cytochrome c maturation protein CcmE [Bacteroidota bacterium]|nr:cytochrome c maturation protein CcmE [Bacteroidota bacterium]
MNVKIIIAVVVIIAALVFGAVSFVETNVEYTDFRDAENAARKVQVKGTWVQDRETRFDADNSTFTFYMADDFGKTVQVVYDGAKPNNFEIADAIVVKGKFHDGSFFAEDILTKCPSKYEGGPEAVQKTL